MPDLILISCSDHKMPYGWRMVGVPDPIPWLQDAELRQKLFKTRSLVFECIKQGRLRDVEMKHGNREYDPFNRGLVKGPDFNGDDYSGLYLPAGLRYIGRFFREVRGSLSDDDTLKLWQRSCGRYQVLIVSGLFGLVSPFDPIQEYTCHFTDRILGTSTGLQIIWRNVLAEIICHLTQDTGSGCKVKLFDLLSEESYQDAFDWGLIYKNANCFHRAYKLKAGPETLINSASFFKNEFFDGKEEPPEFCRDTFIVRKFLDKPKDQILFEAQLKTTEEEVAREGIAEYIPQLKQIYGESWDPLPDRVKNEIANSEYSYQHHCDLRGFDFTAAGICLSKAIEIWLEEKVISPLLELQVKSGKYLKSSQTHQYKKTLGGFATILHIAESKIKKNNWLKVEVKKTFPKVTEGDFEKLADDLNFISSKYRNHWVHEEPMDRETYEAFRQFSSNFFKRWVPKLR
ncbi:MAG: peroxide stress protein YaaA [Candidatus Saccharicenans sp.]